jgi:conjugative relaxase-like TrwC/TraI family protein
MHGGANFYRNTPVNARRYLEADRSRADDYYLTEGTGLAERFSASPTLGVRHEGGLSGNEYEAWVAGVDPVTGVPKGHLRKSENAVRFVEITVNGPKSWSLGAAIHPDISAAYDAAQERAAEQIIGWLASHATTRIGSRGAQVQVPVEEIEAVTVRHYTSRTGDPHRHLHLQVNARVRAEGRWYALHTVGVRDSLDAINGIGHAAVMTDPGFRDALAAHGYTLDADGELTQMREYVDAFSQRTAQIERNLKRYEAAWKRSNAGQEPGPALRQKWDHQAWNDAPPRQDRPKGWCRDHRGVARRTARARLPATGRTGPRGERPTRRTRPGSRGGDGAGATRHAAFGVERRRHSRRGRAAPDPYGVVTAATVRIELAEDLTSRALAECVPLLDRPALPEHLRALTSRHVWDVEADLTARFVARAATAPTPGTVPAAVVTGLDETQQNVVAALAGDGRLLVIEGAAGAGKTTTLAAARTVIEDVGQRLVVVTPTKKAAQIAAKQLGTAAFSAGWLAHQHGWRWDEHGTWTLHVGQVDRDERGRQRPYLGPRPEAQLGRGDVLLVDLCRARDYADLWLRELWVACGGGFLADGCVDEVGIVSSRG